MSSDSAGHVGSTARRTDDRRALEYGDGAVCHIPGGAYYVEAKSAEAERFARVCDAVRNDVARSIIEFLSRTLDGIGFLNACKKAMLGVASQLSWTCTIPWQYQGLFKLVRKLMRRTDCWCLYPSDSQPQKIRSTEHCTRTLHTATRRLPGDSTRLRQRKACMEVRTTPHNTGDEAARGGYVEASNVHEKLLAVEVNRSRGVALKPDDISAVLRAKRVCERVMRNAPSLFYLVWA
nr:hypothetical protein CFP56_20852 [Quercus suber]